MMAAANRLTSNNTPLSAAEAVLSSLAGSKTNERIKIASANRAVKIIGKLRKYIL